MFLAEEKIFPAGLRKPPSCLSTLQLCSCPKNTWLEKPYQTFICLCVCGWCVSFRMQNFCNTQVPFHSFIHSFIFKPVDAVLDRDDCQCCCFWVRWTSELQTRSHFHKQYTSSISVMLFVYSLQLKNLMPCFWYWTKSRQQNQHLASGCCK